VEKKRKDKYIPISKLADETPYSAEYLSLLARLKKLEAKKLGRNWYSTQAAIKKYLARQAERKTVHGNLLKNYAGIEEPKHEVHAAVAPFLDADAGSSEIFKNQKDTKTQGRPVFTSGQFSEINNPVLRP